MEELKLINSFELSEIIFTAKHLYSTIFIHANVKAKGTRKSDVPAHIRKLF